MTRSEEAPHLRTHFRMSDDAGRLNLVLKLRDIAIEFLRPIAAKIPCPISDEARAAYQAEGISLKWDLTTTDDAYNFYFAAQRADLSRSQQSATELLLACTQALEDGAVPNYAQQHILDAYVGLDLDDAVAGRKRKQQASDWGKKGIVARTKYSDSDKTLWAESANSALMAHIRSKNRKAKLIAKKLGLPEAAVQTIAKSI